MNTTYFKNLIMGNVFSTDTSIDIPVSYYIGLSSSAPTADGLNVTEPATGESGYSRIELTSLTVPENGIITNEDAISFSESITDWFPADRPATHYVIFDSSVDGNLLMFNELTASRVIEANTIATIKPSSLYIKLTD